VIFHSYVTKYQRLLDAEFLEVINGDQQMSQPSIIFLEWTYGKTHIYKLICIMGYRYCTLWLFNIAMENG